MKDAHPLFLWFVVGSWLAFGLGSFLFFELSKNASLKKSVFRWSQLLISVLFLGFMASLGAPLPAYLLVIPGLCLVGLLNIWGTKFCPRCGRTLIHAYRARFCSRCGQPLETEDS